MFALPFLAEIGVLISEGAEAIGLGSTASNAIGAGVVAKVTEKVNETVGNAIESVEESILGAETAQNLNKTIAETPGNLFTFLDDPEAFAKKLAAQGVRAHNRNEEPVVPTGAGVQMSSVIPGVGPRNSLSNVFSSSGVAGDLRSLSTRRIGGSSQVAVAPVGVAPVSVAPIDYSISTDVISKYVVNLATNMAVDNSVISATDKAIKTTGSEGGTGILGKITNYLANAAVPTSEEYKKVAAVYNGRVITDKSARMGYDSVRKLIVFQIYDEVGSLITLYQTTGLILPAVPGYVFVGPNSGNAAYPVNLVDTFALMHDASYSTESGGGWFSRKGDLQFISRLAQNKDRFDANEISFVNSTITYFSTVSLALGTLKGELPVEVYTQPIDDRNTSDVFPVVHPEALARNFDDYKIERYNFYKSIDTSVQKEHIKSGYHAIAAQPSNYYGNLFDSLQISVE